MPVIGAWLHRVVEVYFRYHAVPTNLFRLGGFRDEVCRAGGTHFAGEANAPGLTGRDFQLLIDRFVPHCRVLHPYSEERFFASHPTLGKSRMR